MFPMFHLLPSAATLSLLRLSDRDGQQPLRSSSLSGPTCRFSLLPAVPLDFSISPSVASGASSLRSLYTGSFRSQSIHPSGCPLQKLQIKMYSDFHQTRPIMCFCVERWHMYKQASGYQSRGFYLSMIATNFQMCICYSTWALFLVRI